MDAYVTRIKSRWLFLWLWITVFLLAAIQREASAAPAEALGVTGLFVCFLAYPLVLVFASSATNASAGLRLFVAVSLAAFCGAYGAALGSRDDNAADQWFSAMATIALL